jgi:hypothetical protein
MGGTPGDHELAAPTHPFGHALEVSVITLVRMADFPATVEVDGQKFAIQAPVPSPDGATFQILDPAGESLGAIEIGRDGKRRQSRDPTIERVASEAIRRGILKGG